MPVDRQIHRVGVVAAGFAAARLVAAAVASGSTGIVFPVLIYAVGLLAMLGCTAAYSLEPDPLRREWLRRLDHAAIFLMIASTYTPFTTLKLSGNWSTAMTVAIWTLAGTGI